MAFSKINHVVRAMNRLTNPPAALQLGAVIKEKKKAEEEEEEEEEDGKRKEEPEPTAEESLNRVIRNKFHSHQQSTFGLTMAIEPFDMIHVDGKPLPSDASDLYEMGAPSPFGDLKTATTKLDDTVRKAREIGISRIKLTEEGCRFIDHLSERIACKDFIKTENGSALEIKPYKMNIYGETGHFKLHQDTPREGVVASLVISFPYFREGGDLMVQNGLIAFTDGCKPEVHKKNGCQNHGKIRVSVFYSNCPHTVRPVTKGYRVTLACHVMLKPKIVCPVRTGKHMYENEQENRCVMETVKEHEDYRRYHDQLGWRRTDVVRECTLWIHKGRAHVIWVGPRMFGTYSDLFRLADLWTVIIDYACGPGTLYTEMECLFFVHPDWGSAIFEQKASSAGRVQLLAKSGEGEAEFLTAAREVLTRHQTFGILLSCRYSYEELKVGLWKNADHQLMLMSSTEIADEMEVQLMPIIVRRKGEWAYDGSEEAADMDDTIFRMTGDDFDILSKSEVEPAKSSENSQSSESDVEQAVERYQKLPEGAPRIPFFYMSAEAGLIRKEEDPGAETTGNESRNQSCDNTYFQVAALFRSKTKTDPNPYKRKLRDRKKRKVR